MNVCDIACVNISGLQAYATLNNNISGLQVDATTTTPPTPTTTTSTPPAPTTTPSLFFCLYTASV